MNEQELLKKLSRRAIARIKTAAEEFGRSPVSRERQDTEIETILARDPLAEIKDALAAGTLTGPEAIDRAYRLGFKVGEQAKRKAA